MITLISKVLPIGWLVGVGGLALALQLVGVDVMGVASNLLLDLLGLPDWSGNWFGSLL